MAVSRRRTRRPTSVWHTRTEMTNSKHRAAKPNGQQPGGTPEAEQDVGVSGLPRAKLFYMTSGYGFGDIPEGADQTRAVDVTP